MTKITNKLIESIKPKDREFVHWDTQLKGLGVRVYPTGRKVLFLQYRYKGRTRKLKLGVYPSVTAEQVRKRTLTALGALSEGEDPDLCSTSGSKITMEELCVWYLKEGVAAKKTSTIVVDEGRIKRHIIPLIGPRFVSSITSADVERMQIDIATGKTALDVKNKKPHSRTRVRGGKGTAARTVGLLGGILTFGVKRGLISQNAVRGVRKFEDKVRTRVLSPEEWKNIGHVLTNEDSIRWERKQAIRLLMATGCRRGEIQTLRWDCVDGEADSSLLTGPRPII